MSESPQSPPPPPKTGQGGRSQADVDRERFERMLDDPEAMAREQSKITAEVMGEPQASATDSDAAPVPWSTIGAFVLVSAGAYVGLNRGQELLDGMAQVAVGVLTLFLLGVIFLVGGVLIAKASDASRKVANAALGGFLAGLSVCILFASFQDRGASNEGNELLTGAVFIIVVAVSFTALGGWASDRTG